MKHAHPMEIEMKFRIPALAPARLRLEACGFLLASAQGPELSVLWDRDGELRAQGGALRLRRYGGTATLTWKGARVPDPLLKIRPEVETTVGDPAALEGILGQMGFGPVFEMRKSRSVWNRGALVACLDEAPFGCYLELEGSPGAIREAMGQLGLEEAQVEPRSYVTLFRELG
ncbi:class IV adenylate cyclase [Mesoterricola silvestris]|uniref:CYTH domain-containing protein n=1 Tax=Mesoterricola silvestris TaxID=2927979 RepID=A0AA48GN76_9BACT|nr:class IV adenylate cyclase [Mesoterricola silvestris]BDU74439.1 hypothetical protein METEAL_36130 [Mesoterricola silvestris]